MLNYQITCSQSNTNGSRYFVSAAAAVGFVTEAVRCSYWLLQWIHGRNNRIVGRHDGAVTEESRTSRSLFGEWILHCSSVVTVLQSYVSDRTSELRQRKVVTIHTTHFTIKTVAILYKLLYVSRLILMNNSDIFHLSIRNLIFLS